MQPNQIAIIARFLTEDPDIFCEMGGSIGGNIGKSSGTSQVATSKTPLTGQDPKADKPLSSIEIQQQAQDRAGSPDASQQVADQMKMQQDIEKQQELQKQKVIAPQMMQLQQAMQKLNVGVQQGKQASATGGEQYGALEKEMTNINSLLSNLQKQI